MSTVYLVASNRLEPEKTHAEKLALLFDKAEFSFCFRANHIAALKLHVGEPGTRTHIPPHIAAALVTCMKENGARPFLTDTAVLYRSPRDTGVGHAEVAYQHGFTLDRTGAPFIPADGILGKDGISLPVFGKHFEAADMARAIVEAQSMLVLSHVTGHLGTGFGAALKNLGMGCSTKKAKLSQHHGHQPYIISEKCIACGSCADHCPSEAINILATAIIDPSKCIGCGECVATCRDEAIGFDWRVMGSELAERIAEHAAAIARQKRGFICFVNVAMDITKDCDCMGVAQSPLIEDIGFLASTDPVALDQATHDLIVEQTGNTLESRAYPSRDGTLQMVHGERLKIGTRRYELVKITDNPIEH